MRWESENRQWNQWKPRGDGRSQWSADSWHRVNWDLCVNAGIHQFHAGVRNAWRSRVCDQRHVGTGLESRQELGHSCPNIVLVEAQRGSRNSVVGEQFRRAPRVFRSNHIDLAENAQRPQRHVLQVANGCCDHEQRAGDRVQRVVIVPLTG